MLLSVNSDYFLEQHSSLVFVMVKYGILFKVRAKFLNIIKASFGFKG
jgi:hypothetical protein